MTAERPITRPRNAVANGPVAAALLSCAFGCFVLGVLAVAADGSKSLSALFNFYNPTGPLAGVTTVAIALWLICWAVLSRLWSTKTVPLGRISAIAFVLLGGSLLLTFPPFGDLLLGR